MQDELDVKTEIFKLLRQQLSPLAKVYDPLYAGNFASYGTKGSFYLTQLQHWLWLPGNDAKLESGDEFLTDRQLAESLDLCEVLRNLLRSARSSFDVLLRHLDKIEPLPTFLTDLGFFLVRPEARVVDIIRANHLHNWRNVEAE